jgi:methionyl aminopeptidase
MIVCRSRSEIEKLRRSGRLVRQLLEETRRHALAGMTTLDLENFVVKRLKEVGARPAFKGYRGYPCCLCASVNEEIIHGIPSGRRLKDGDIVSLDLGVIVDGYYGDSALTAAVGEISEPLQRLLRVTQECLDLGIHQARAGNRVGDISSAVQRHAEENGYSVVREFVGHGVGRALHEEPQVPNYGQAGRGPLLKPGMVIAIEPMVNAGGPAVRVLKDNWTAVTADGQYSAHFEHMVAITSNGADVLTEPEEALRATDANLVSTGREGRL